MQFRKANVKRKKNKQWKKFPYKLFSHRHIFVFYGFLFSNESKATFHIQPLVVF